MNDFIARPSAKPGTESLLALLPLPKPTDYQALPIPSTTALVILRSSFFLPHLRPSSPCVLSLSSSVSASSSSPHSSCPKHGPPLPSQMDIGVCGFLAHKTPKSLYATDKAHISESGVKNLPRLGLHLLICPLACQETHYWSARLHTEWTGEATEAHRTLARLSDK